MNIVFPENTGQLPQVAKRPLSFTHVLAVVYCFGGVAGVLAILSKFVTTPLFEELTYDRSIFANEARMRLIDFNALLSASVSRIPPTEVAKTGYVDAVVQAGEESSQRATASSSKQLAEVRESLKALRMLVRSTDPNDTNLRQTSLLTSQTDDLTQYVRSLQYEPMPGTFIPQLSNAHRDTPNQSLGRAIVQCKNDIRALKGSLLSS